MDVTVASLEHVDRFTTKDPSAVLEAVKRGLARGWNVSLVMVCPSALGFVGVRSLLITPNDELEGCYDVRYYDASSAHTYDVQGLLHNLSEDINRFARYDSHCETVAADVKAGKYATTLKSVSANAAFFAYAMKNAEAFTPAPTAAEK